MGSIQGSSMIWERSGRPGRFSFFPKGALTHHPEGAVVFPSETVRSARRMRLHLRPKSRRYATRLASETLACGLVCGSLMDNATSRWAAVIVHAVGKELPIWKPLLWVGKLPTHSAACLQKSAIGSFVAVMGASCFVTHPFSFLRKRNKKKGR